MSDLKLVLMLVALPVCASLADSAGGPLILSYYEGVTGDAEIAAADYAGAEKAARKAIRVAHILGEPSRVVELYNNLCVALVMDGSSAEATKLCNHAVIRAKRLRRSPWQPPRYAKSVQATTFSNRGVSRAARGDPLGAKADFAIAMRLQPRLQPAIKNLKTVEDSGHHTFLGDGSAIRANRQSNDAP